MHKPYTASLTQQQLSELVGYSRTNVYRINQQLPEGGKLFVRSTEGAYYDLATFVQHWVDYNVKKATDEESMDFGEIKTQHERVKKHKTELQVQVMEGELIPVKDVRRLWGDVIDTARKALLQVSNQVAPQLLMIDSVEKIANVIDERIREELEHIADTPLPGYVEGGDEE